MKGRQCLIELAYLMTYASCEIEYEDRLRLNLIGNALDISINGVEAIINHVRQQGYYGVRRFLPVAESTR